MEINIMRRNYKPNTYLDRPGHRPKLHVMMTCYGSIIRQNPQAWLRGMVFTEAELRQYPDIAVAIGQLPESTRKSVLLEACYECSERTLQAVPAL